jgi:hypothetical protein
MQSDPVGKYLICPGSFNKDENPHVVRIEDSITDDFGIIALALCDICCIEFKTTKCDGLLLMEEAKKTLKELSDIFSIASKSKNTCKCDFDTVIMTVGCQCGGK